MQFLITAGSSQSMIDRLRCVTSVFTGRTGAAIARTAWGRGHSVTLVTARPETLLEYGMNYREPGERFTVVPYRTFDELAVILPSQLKAQAFDAVCYAAAAGDFLPAGTFVPQTGTFFNARTGEWESADHRPQLTEQRVGKLPLSEPELWVRLVRGPRLIDRLRNPWGYSGLLVPFVMEVGLGDSELIHRAEQARLQCGADLMVASTLEMVAHTVFLGPLAGRYEPVSRRDLPDRLVLALEIHHQERLGPERLDPG
jgi:phosphopantothenoylcysteine synthetase/decarboxylase